MELNIMFRYFSTFLVLSTIPALSITYKSIFPELDDIIPHGLNVKSAVPLTVIYKTTKLTPGDLILPQKMVKQPEVFWQAKCDYFYHLLMYDGDAPSRTNHSWNFIKHWLLVNIPGMHLKRGESIAVYGGGLPPWDTDIHRYVFLLFESPSSVVFDEPISPRNSLRNRANFNISKFCHKYGLLKVVAMNYLTSEWDPYVDTYTKNHIVD